MRLLVAVGNLLAQYYLIPPKAKKYKPQIPALIALFTVVINLRVRDLGALLGLFLIVF